MVGFCNADVCNCCSLQEKNDLDFVLLVCVIQHSLVVILLHGIPRVNLLAAGLASIRLGSRVQIFDDNNGESTLDRASGAKLSAQRVGVSSHFLGAGFGCTRHRISPSA